MPKHQNVLCTQYYGHNTYFSGLRKNYKLKKSAKPVTNTSYSCTHKRTCIIMAKYGNTCTYVNEFPKCIVTLGNSTWFKSMFLDTYA